MSSNSTAVQRPEVLAFIERIHHVHPGGALDDALQPSLDFEAKIRRLWATDKTNIILQDPYVGLLEVFATPDALRVTNARKAKEAKTHATDDQDEGDENEMNDLQDEYIMPLKAKDRRKTGEPCIVKDMKEFIAQFQIFTESGVSQLDWSNVVVAGGCVLACLLPVPDKAKVSKRALRKWFHTTQYPTSDIDLFLWGLTPEQAEVKIKAIYQAVRDSVPWDVTCVRTKHAVSIHSQYPYRSVQIVLRLYSSPAEILAGFDVDAPCCAYDGKTVWANPRAMVAFIRQCNTVDVTRRSPSYEMRLTKYAVRGFEVYVPDLRRDDIDPTIYERSTNRISGLARLLVLEKLAHPETRVRYLDHRRALRGRPSVDRSSQHQGPKFKGDLKADMAMNGLAMNDYDVSSLHIPYGPGWDARRIEKLVYQTDLGMNSPFNPKNKNRCLHRHPAFFGTMEECIEDCCEFCPEAALNDEDGIALQKAEDEKYLRGRIAFMQENPGRQSISGSFNPIDSGEWSAQAYIGRTERFFAAVAADDRMLLAALIDEGADPNRRDHVGRAPLHVAILSHSAGTASDLIDAGARMTARLVDGRTALHVAAQMGMGELIRKMFLRSALNKQRAEQEAETKKGQAKGQNTGSDEQDDYGMEVDDEETPDTSTVRMSSEDDWSSDSDDDKAVVEPSEVKDEVSPGDAAISGEVPEDSADEPDVLEPNLPDWDLAFTPLDHAVTAYSLDALSELLARKADAIMVTKAHGYIAQPIHALTLTGVLANKDEAARIATRLIMGGASTTMADENSLSVFQRLVCMPGNAGLVATILRNDAKARLALHYPYFVNGTAVYPLVSAVSNADWAMVAVLLAHGAKVDVAEDDVSQAKDAHEQRQRKKHGDRYYSQGDQKYPGNVYPPIEVALGNQDQLAFLLLRLRAEINLQLHSSHKYPWGKDVLRSIVEFAQDTVKHVNKLVGDDGGHEEDATVEEGLGPARLEVETWKEYWRCLCTEMHPTPKTEGAGIAKTEAELKEGRKKMANLTAQQTYWTEVTGALQAAGAKTWNELRPDNLQDRPKDDNNDGIWHREQKNERVKPVEGYKRYTTAWSQDPVPKHLWPLYDELFQACWAGDNEKIKKLCVPEELWTGDNPVLEVAVEVDADMDRTHRGSYDSRFTALHVALLRKHWDTAKLLIALVISQYKPDEEELGKFNNDDSDEDEDEDADSDMESDGTAEPIVGRFVDLTTKATLVESKVDVIRYMKTPSRWVGETDVIQVGDPLSKAIHQQNLGELKRIAELYAIAYKSSGSFISAVHLIHVFSSDNVEILDALICLDGIGGPNTAESTKEEESQAVDSMATMSQIAEKPKEKPGKRVYWGLNVHGMKRKDLASKNDPNASPDIKTSRIPEMPLLWHAACYQAVNIMTYLNTKRPLEAYQHYADTSNDARAKYLRNKTDLEETYPEWIGWKQDGFGQSAIVASLFPSRHKKYKDESRDVRLVALEKLFELQPALMAQQVDLPNAASDSMSPVLIAANQVDNPCLLEFLISKGASLYTTDINGWNIVHKCANGSRKENLKWLLKTQSRETLADWMIGRVAESENTALHLSTTRDVVELLTKDDIQPCALTARNREGLIPLHVAVSGAKADLIEPLLKAAARTNMDINVENGMGDSPLDVARQQFWLYKTRHAASMGTGLLPALLTQSYNAVPPKTLGIDVSNMEERLASLKSIITELTQTGNLVQGTSVANALGEWVLRLDEHVDHLRALTQDASLDQTIPGKMLDEWREVVLELVQQAYTARKQPRKLVHLEDVQHFVQLELNRRQARAEKIMEVQAKATERKGGLLEGHESDSEGEEEPAFHGFAEINALSGKPQFCCAEHARLAKAKTRSLD